MRLMWTIDVVMKKPNQSPYEQRQHASSADVVWHRPALCREDRARQKKQKPVCIWLTGLSGSGKSTMANALEQALFEAGHHTMLLDGDNVRHGLCKDLGMTDQDRTENIRRVAELAKLMTEAGLIVVTAFISPFRQDRQLARALFGPGEFVEVYVNTSLAVCKARDPKGLYKKAMAGVIKDFTGISSPYEAPTEPEIQLDCGQQDVASSLQALVRAVQQYIS